MTQNADPPQQTTIFCSSCFNAGGFKNPLLGAVQGHGRALAQASSSAAGVDASVWVVPPYGSLSYAELLELLGGNSSAPDASGIRLTGLQNFSKIGLAGNGLCELGELPTADNAGKPHPHTHTFRFSDCFAYLPVM